MMLSFLVTFVENKFLLLDKAFADLSLFHAAKVSFPDLLNQSKSIRQILFIWAAVCHLTNEYRLRIIKHLVNRVQSANAPLEGIKHGLPLAACSLR